MDIQIEDSWKTALGNEFVKDYFKQLTTSVRDAYLTTKFVTQLDY